VHRAAGHVHLEWPSLYKEKAMNVAKPMKAAATVGGFVRFNSEQAARHKRERDERRRTLRAHNARAASLKK